MNRRFFAKLLVGLPAATVAWAKGDAFALPAHPPATLVLAL